jgi:hypothetical protein
LSSDTQPLASEANRQSHVDLADADNRIDGLIRDTQTDAIFMAYIAGEIPVTDIVARLHTLLGS